MYFITGLHESYLNDHVNNGSIKAFSKVPYFSNNQFSIQCFFFFAEAFSLRYLGSIL